MKKFRSCHGWESPEIPRYDSVTIFKPQYHIIAICLEFQYTVYCDWTSLLAELHFCCIHLRQWPQSRFVFLISLKTWICICHIYFKFTHEILIFSVFKLTQYQHTKCSALLWITPPQPKLFQLICTPTRIAVGLATPLSFCGIIWEYLGDSVSIQMRLWYIALHIVHAELCTFFFQLENPDFLLEAPQSR